MRRFSPYIYGFNNPIRFIDPDGRWPDRGELAHGAINTVGGVVAVVGGVVGGTASSVTVVGGVAGATAAAGAGAIVLGTTQIVHSFRSDQNEKPLDAPSVQSAVATGVSKRLGASDKTAAAIGTVTDIATGGKPKSAFDAVSLASTVVDFAGTNHSAKVKAPVTDHTATVTTKPKPIIEQKPNPEPTPQPVIKSGN